MHLNQKISNSSDCRLSAACHGALHSCPAAGGRKVLRREVCYVQDIGRLADRAKEHKAADKSPFLKKGAEHRKRSKALSALADNQGWLDSRSKDDKERSAPCKATLSGNARVPC